MAMECKRNEALFSNAGYPKTIIFLDFTPNKQLLLQIMPGKKRISQNVMTFLQYGRIQNSIFFRLCVHIWQRSSSAPVKVSLR
jgi:hypothetical protein